MKKFFFLLLIMVIASCGGAKYNYFFDTGKQLDFSKGKWILNNTESNSKIFDRELYDASFKEFEKILGDSLLEMNELRSSKLVAPKIKFNLAEIDLKELRQNTDSDYLINIKGNAISDGAGSLTLGNETENSSNRASVSINIYDLNAAILISSSQVYGKTVHNEPIFPEDKNPPILNPSSNMIMVKGAKKLIRKYEKNGIGAK